MKRLVLLLVLTLIPVASHAAAPAKNRLLQLTGTLFDGATEQSLDKSFIFVRGAYPNFGATNLDTLFFSRSNGCSTPNSPTPMGANVVVSLQAELQETTGNNPVSTSYACLLIGPIAQIIGDLFGDIFGGVLTQGGQNIALGPGSSGANPSGKIQNYSVSNLSTLYWDSGLPGKNAVMQAHIKAAKEIARTYAAGSFTTDVWYLDAETYPNNAAPLVNNVDGDIWWVTDDDENFSFNALESIKFQSGSAKRGTIIFADVNDPFGVTRNVTFDTNVNVDAASCSTQSTYEVVTGIIVPNGDLTITNNAQCLVNLYLFVPNGAITIAAGSNPITITGSTLVAKAIVINRRPANDQDVVIARGKTTAIVPPLFNSVLDLAVTQAP